MKGITYTSVLIALFALVFHANSFAQSGTGRSLNYRADLGFGTSYTNRSTNTPAGIGVSARTALSVEVERVILTLPATFTYSPASDYSTGFIRVFRLRDYYMDYGILLGYSIPTHSSGDFKISGGVSRVLAQQVKLNDCWDDDYNSGWLCAEASKEKLPPVTSFVFELGYHFKTDSFVRPALIAHINLNPHSRFVGLTLNIGLGRH